MRKKIMEIFNETSTGEQTSIKPRKGRDGWHFEQIIKAVNGYDWRISTHKFNDGTIRCMAKAGKCGSDDHSPFMSWSTSIMTDPDVELAKRKCRATEKSIKEIHIEGLIAWDNLVDAGELPGKTSEELNIQVGQLVFVDGYGCDDRYAIYDIKNDGFYLINVEDLSFHHTTRVKPYTEKYGIGYYFNPEEKISLDELTNLVIEGRRLEADLQIKESADRQLKEAERDAKIEQGKKLVHIPEWAKGVITAHYKEDQSDGMTDYFAHRTTKTYYLAFSTHTKNLFPEMRKAAANCDELTEFVHAPEDWEHRDNYSMGHGFWLGKHLHHGWEIVKGGLDPDRNDFNNLYIAAAEGRFFCNASSTPKDTSSESDSEVSGTTDFFEIQHTQHTKKHHDLYVITMRDYVSKEKFNLYYNKVKEFSGYYSSYSRSGAIPGFQFTDQSKAKQCLSVLNELIND